MTKHFSYSTDGPALPIIDVSALVAGGPGEEAVALNIGDACRDAGFFYIVGHGIDDALQQRLEVSSRQFFAQALETKLQIRMERGGKAWRGYFPVGAELTSGEADVKEGIYFGTELDENDARVRAGMPLHGPNLFPDGVPSMRKTVLEYLSAMTELGHRLMTGFALSLGLERSYFHERYTYDPLTLFRIFHYPPVQSSQEADSGWGVGEHTDYGMLTILKQDDVGGLQVKSRDGWMDAPPVPGSFVCNIGDMMDRLTRGLYRSTPHRVRNTGNVGRLSFPFFFDPSFDARLEAIDLSGVTLPHDDKEERWDRASVHEFKGTYGDYILSKVSRVFPELRRAVL